LLSGDELQRLWTALADDAPKAYRAIADLVAAHGQTTPFLAQHLAALAAEEQSIDKLIAQLDNDRFEARERATRELANLGKLAEAALREALAGNLSVEARRRVELLLKDPAKLNRWAAHLQALRAVEALEYMDTPESRKALSLVVQKAPTARLTKEAKESLGRLSKQVVPKP